jgi:outer membrane lipoprotein SlyB
MSRVMKCVKSRTAKLAAIGLFSTLTIAPLSGCDNAGQGAFSGAALGALAGLGIGSLTGDMGKGAAAGAIIGGLGGLLIGDQNDRNSRR